MNNKAFKIEKLDHFGRGIVKLDNKIVFVENAVVGDEVSIKIVKDKKKYSEAEIVSFINKSSKRREFCKYSSVCGGCNISDTLYDYQLKYKEQKIKEIVSKYLKENIKINPIIFSKDSNYRNKITLHVNKDKIGLYEKSTNSLIEIKSCKLVDYKINETINRLKLFVKKTKHNLKNVVIKKTTLNEMMLVFYGDIEEKVVLEEFSDINSIFINDKCLNNKYITEKLGDYKFLLSKDSFFQVNSYNTINLYNEVIRMMENKRFDKVLDLYCGTGTIGIFASKYAREVVGIEVVKDAIEAANINKEINDIKNITFINGKVEDNIDKFLDVDLIIVDPPRSGLDNKTISNILKIKSNKIIYVSCDPMTLVRDLNLLKENYNIEEITPVDMFPNTYHVESVVCLNRKKCIHNMQLHPEPFELIESGKKTIELRLLDEKRKLINKEDTIVFTDRATKKTLQTKVVNLYKFNSFEELYKSLSLLKCGYTSDNVDKATYKDMEQYYSKEEQDKYGVVGIEVCLMD